MIKYRTDLPEPQQFYALFETTGWNQLYGAPAKELLRALQNSWYVLTAYDGERLVGCGRVVTDQVLHAMIYEMIVVPEYQGQGIGEQILKRLLDKCLEAGIRDIQLFCARGKRGFYEKYGFYVRPDDAPGMQYRRSG